MRDIKMSIGSKDGTIPIVTIIGGENGDGDGVVGCLYFEYYVSFIREKINIPIPVGRGGPVFIISML